MSDDSDSSLSEVKDALPPDADIESALRGVVIRAFQDSDFDQLTLKRVRATVENQLDVPENFFKTDTEWSTKSKEIVTDQVTKCENEQGEPEPPKATKVKDTVPAKKPAKRRSAEPQRPATKKRRRTAIESSDIEDEDETPASPGLKSQPEPAIQQTEPSTEQIPELGPDSELSDVIDDAPVSKPKKKKKQTPAPKPTKPDSTSSKTKKSKGGSASSAATISPQEDEIKKLQAQLVKCGIRRLWGKELVKFGTPAEKVAHLKGMLREVGMTGRFSEDKARQIKEERELRADLEDIQQGEERWGKGEKEQSRRPVARGLAELQGLFDDEESDD